jgi:NADPH-dependent F420 reductase
MASPVCIVGATGQLGYGLALRLGRAGTPIVIGSRDAGRAREAAERAGAAVPEGTFSGAENPEAVTGCEIVILSVPFASQAQTLASIKESLGDGQLLIDATVPLASAVGGKPTRTIAVWQGSAAEQAQELVGDRVRVVSAFQTVSAETLTDLDHQLGEDVLVCGDKRVDKDRAMELIGRIDGLRPVNAGALETARITETLTALLVSINIRNKVRAGIRITGLPQ